MDTLFPVGFNKPGKIDCISSEIPVFLDEHVPAFLSFLSAVWADYWVIDLAHGSDPHEVLSPALPDGRKGLVEVIELADHPFFLASQYHPEYKSRPRDPHPLFKGFIEAALAYRNARATNPGRQG